MSTEGARLMLITALLSGGILTGCGDASDQTVAPAATTKKPDANRTSILPAEMVAAVSSGRTASLIGVHFAVRAAPTVGQPLPVDIAIVPHQEFTALRVHFESHDGVEVTEGKVFGPVSDLPLEKPLNHKIVLLPSKDGVFMVTAILETEGGDGSVSRIYSIPVIVSASTGAAAGSKAAEPAPAGQH